MQYGPEKTRQAEAPTTSTLRFHGTMACAMLLFAVATGVIWRMAGVYVEHWRSSVLALAIALLVSIPLPIYWHQQKRPELRESSLAVMWALAFAVILALPVSALARLGGPLQDVVFARIDGALGVSVPAIAAWAERHGASGFLDRVYGLLPPLMGLAVLVPGLTGKWKQARVFVLGNVLAFVLGLPLFTMFPAVGPWYAYKLHATVEQLKCQADLLAMRGTGPAVNVAGIVCFPSYHVIWAILCAYAFSGFRRLRVPVTVLCGLIVISTMTSGWHYFVDVLGGCAVSTISIAIARWISMPAAAKQKCAGSAWIIAMPPETESAA